MHFELMKFYEYVVFNNRALMEQWKKLNFNVEKLGFFIFTYGAK